MINLNIQPELKDRIVRAAQELYEQAGREQFPTVDAVRRYARADMNTTSAVMREWRKLQHTAPVSVAAEVPAELMAANNAAAAALWQQAQQLANESLAAAEAAWAKEREELELLRAELSNAYDSIAEELDALKIKEQASKEQAAREIEEIMALLNAEKVAVASLKTQRTVNSNAQEKLEQDKAKLEVQLEAAIAAEKKALEEAAELRGALRAVQDQKARN